MGEAKRKKYLRSGLFKRLFFSYALIILTVFVIFIGWFVVSYHREAEELETRKWEQRAASFGAWMDQQLMQAEMLCSAVNASESARMALQTVYVEKQTMNSLQMYNLLGELNRIKGSVRSASVNNLILAFQGERKLFLPGAVYSLEGECQALHTSPFFGLDTAAGLLGVQGHQILLNKEYLIYGEDYTGFGSQSSPKGQVLVLIEPDQIRTALRDRVDGEASLKLLRRGQTVLEIGEARDRVLSIPSEEDRTVVCEISLPGARLASLLPVSAWIPLAVMIAAGLFFLVLIYRNSLRYYRPIESIHRLVDIPAEGKEEAPEERKSDEFDAIVQGISSLIGERNGYRERMVTITPYARQGMLQAAMRGAGHPGTLVEENFTELKRDYYMAGVVNVAILRESAATERGYRDRQELILSVCRDLSEAEGPQVVAVPENLQNTFVIAASDERDGFEAFFYRLYELIVEAAGDSDTVITIGAGHRENDLERLSSACGDAQAALGQMLTGGRGAVYFPEENRDAAPAYSFPKDAQKQMIRLLKEKDLQGLNDLLDDIYQKNLVEADLPAAVVRQLADELYWTIRKALRNAYDLSTTHLRLEPIRDAATIEEIFEYYRQVFRVSLSEAGDSEEKDREKNLEDDLCEYLEAHLYDPELSLNSVADRFGVSTKMIGLICKKRYGQTFLNYVRDRQIHHAAEMLRETDLSLEEIAAQCGFANILTFRRNFRTVMGVNPSEYRG